MLRPFLASFATRSTPTKFGSLIRARRSPDTCQPGLKTFARDLLVANTVRNAFYGAIVNPLISQRFFG
jgi:hypothetical protein